MEHTATSTDLGLELAPGLVRLAWRLAGQAEADDLVQATYLRALEHHGTVRQPRAWLRRVLLNERWMGLRARRRRDDRERAAAPTDDAVDVEHVLHCLEVARLVDRLVDALDDDVRLVVRERYLEGRTSAEIARRHGIPAGTVRWRLKQGLDRLRRELDAHHGGRRVLWAGAFAPLAVAPTDRLAAASSPSTAHGTSAVATRGPIMKSIKIQWWSSAAAVVALGAGAAHVMTRDHAEPTQPDPSPAPALASTDAPTRAAPSPDAAASRPAPVAALAPAGEADAPSPARQSWATSRAVVAAAQGAVATTAPGFSWTQLDGGDVEVPEGEVEFHQAAGCAAPGCIERLTQEVSAVVDGCRDLAPHAAPDATVVATVLGAPDVGTLVDTVELRGADDAPAELRECLTEGMATLDLGATDRSFSQTVTVLLGAHATRALGGPPSTPDPTRAPRVVFMGKQEPGDHDP